MKQRTVFAQRFSKLRGDRSQQVFAADLGISRQTVGFYENGERTPDVPILQKIAEKCNVSADWLIGMSDVMTPDPTFQGISEKTGLSEDAIKKLQELRKQNYSRAYSDAISILLTCPDVEYFLSLVAAYFSIDEEELVDVDVKHGLVRVAIDNATLLENQMFVNLQHWLPIMRIAFQSEYETVDARGDRIMAQILKERGDTNGQHTTAP